MSKILLVEDDSTLAMGIQYSVKNEGYDVDVANNISLAKNLFNQNEYNLVLLDVMLPDGNGYEFCKYIRTKSKVPVIFLTACDEEVNVVLGLDIGADDYITKPFRVRELISRIKAVLRRYQTKKSSQILVSGDIKIFILETKVLKCENPMFLTPLEYKLLLNFMKHPKRVLSRTNILENLWDIEGEFVDDNTLSVYIKRLREKIEDDYSKPQYIKTVRGLGYKWNVEVRGD